MTQQVQQYLGYLCQFGMLQGIHIKPQHKTDDKKKKKTLKHNNKSKYYSANICIPLKKHCVDCDWALLDNK